MPIRAAGPGPVIGNQDARANLLEVLANASAPAESLPDLRAYLHESGVGKVVLTSVSAPNAPPRGCSVHPQIALPLAGLFTWTVGRRIEVVDANTVLFVAGGQEYSEAHPVKGQGHVSVIVEPAPAILEELRSARSSSGTDLFSRVVQRATPKAQFIAQRIAVFSPGQAESCGGELIVGLLLEVVSADQIDRPRRSGAVVKKAKEYIHSLGSPRLSLEDAAHEIGVTPIYLTQAFKASEGIPLYRYYLNLRLSQALHRLPRANSITDLALELGFSSHSHFSAAFFSRFGIPPSEYRNMTRAPSVSRRIMSWA